MYFLTTYCLVIIYDRIIEYNPLTNIEINIICYISNVSYVVKMKILIKIIDILKTNFIISVNSYKNYLINVIIYICLKDSK